MLAQCCLSVSSPTFALGECLGVERRAHRQFALLQGNNLSPPNVNSSQFGMLKQIALPGGNADQVYAQPLYVENLTITGEGTSNGMHNVVIVATEDNNVYAYDTITFQKLWSLNLGTPIAYFAAGGPNFNNFTGPLGVTGTPIIDPTTDIMYLDSTRNQSPAASIHKIFSINITDGATVNSMTLGGVAGGIIPKSPHFFRRGLRHG